MQLDFDIQRFADTLQPTDGNDIIYNKNGDYSYIDAAGGDDYIYGLDNDYVTVHGNTGNDTIIGSFYHSEIYGDDGDDLMSIVSSNDSNTIYGNEGNDTIYAFTGLIDGGEGSDTIMLLSSLPLRSTVIGGKGDDVIYGYRDSRSSVLYKYSVGDGNDFIYNYHTNDTISVGNSWSTVTVDKDSVIIDGIDTITDSTTDISGSWYLGTIKASDSSIVTVTAADVYITLSDDSSTSATSTVNLSPYKDKLSFTAQKISVKVDTVNAQNETVKATVETISAAIVGSHALVHITDSYGVEEDGNIFLFNAGNKKITMEQSGNFIVNTTPNAVISVPSSVHDSDLTATLTTADDVVDNSGNNSYINGGAGNDSILNNGGIVTVHGGAGNDTISGTFLTSAIYGDAGNDYIVIGEGSDGANSIEGGLGDDTIIAMGGYIDAGAGNDVVSITGNADSTIVIGGKGNDTIYGNSDATVGVLYQYYIGDGNDAIYNFNSNDTIVIEDPNNSDANIVWATLVSGSNVIVNIVGSGTITLYNASDTTLNISGEGNNYIINRDTNATISNNNSSDIPTGLAVSNDIITASPNFTGKTINLAQFSNVNKVNATVLKNPVEIIGNDNNNSLRGGSGNDTLRGGKGNDTLTGGTGKDVFIYESGNDVITDYNPNDDTIKASGKISDSSLKGADVIVSFDNGTLTVKGMANKPVTIIDGDNNSTVLTKSNTVSGGNSTNATTAPVTVPANNSSQGRATITNTTSTVSPSTTPATTTPVTVSPATTTTTTTTYVSPSATFNANKTSLAVKGNFGKNIWLGVNPFTGQNDSYTNANTVTLDASQQTGNAIILAGNDKNNVIRAGGGRSSLWGGGNSDDTLIGGSARDMFWFTEGGGNDVARNFKTGRETDSDVVNIAGNLSKLTRNNSNLYLEMADGSSFNMNFADSSVDKAVQYSTDGSKIISAKIGNTNSGNTFTYESNVDYYIGGGGENVLSVSGGNNVEVWLDSDKFSDIQNINASNSTGRAILAGDNSNNKITAGSGNNSLWGGNYGDDTLIGGSGTNMFWYGKNNGNDVIQKSAAGDVINLFDINLSDLADAKKIGTNLVITTNSGDNLTVTDNSAATFRLADNSSWKYNHSNDTWNQA